MTESPYGQHGARLHPERSLRRLELRDTPDDLLDALRLTSQEDRLRLLDPALWRSLETIIHNQRVLFDMLERLLERTSSIVTDLSPIASAVANETTAEKSAIVLLQQLADEVRANAGDPAAVQQLADQITANADALAQAVTANTPAASTTSPPPTGDGPTASGAVDLSGSGSFGDPVTSDPIAPGAATTTADVSTSSVGQTDGGIPSLPLYLHVGDGPVDSAQWPLVTGSQTLGGQSLYNYAGDSPGGAPTGASADWQVYSGPVMGQVGGSDSGTGAPHTPIDTTGI